jgi:hypothetical protein
MLARTPAKFSSNVDPILLQTKLHPTHYTVKEVVERFFENYSDQFRSDEIDKVESLNKE